MRKYFLNGFQEIKRLHKRDVMSGTRDVGAPWLCAYIETCALCGLVPRRV